MIVCTISFITKSNVTALIKKLLNMNNSFKICTSIYEKRDNNIIELLGEFLPHGGNHKECHNPTDTICMI